ncbi:hypothetical protein Q3H58_002977 [Pseudomonas psychrotolerans]|nr:hypothetical protein [Pseudomonas psychrotolerans]
MCSGIELAWAPVQHQAVELGQWMADVHQQHHAAERMTAAQIGLQVLLPVLLERDRHLGVAITGQVHQAPLFIEGKEVEQLGTSRRLGRTRQARVGQRIERTGFAGVGAPGEGDFPAAVGRTLLDLGGTDEKGRLLAQTDDGILEAGHGRTRDRAQSSSISDAPDEGLAHR